MNLSAPFAGTGAGTRSKNETSRENAYRFSTDLSISGTKDVRGRMSVVRTGPGRTRIVASFGPKPPALNGSSENSYPYPESPLPPAPPAAAPAPPAGAAPAPGAACAYANAETKSEP